ncbi:SusC/RagA family TonB-linked outer membrane protein [Flavisolibacter tropicus]|uniref:TonB-dependent receptor plug domain-containing protein n=1 Tax=Flavisolibacter tropicus TaxID=1492898 RepID=A0A172U2I0_9BACT|nr:SusC/RagA family TonB-linked outer membrane protein [Flavisolibacter tropicus]ANE53187.1 hypothetical protein SY85_24700 [Flavisolibacter tropicus]
MRSVLSGSTAALCLFLCTAQSSSAQKLPSSGQPSNVSAVSIQKLKLTIRDLEDGALLDSVSVVVGSKKGYTNDKGYIELDSVRTYNSVSIYKTGYYPIVKKLKTEMQVFLLKKEKASGVAIINNGLFERPAEHTSGSTVVVSGNELRKVNALDFSEALRFYAPSFVVTRDNNNGNDPNASPDIKIRGSYSFPASAAVAGSATTENIGVQVNPSSGDFMANTIANPNQPLFFVNGVQVALRSALDIDINRIEKITLLKDAAATTVYGIRGGNGVVLIETVRPAEGKMRVSYNGQVQVTDADLSSYNLMTAQEKLAFEEQNGLYAANPELYKARQNQVLNKGVQTDWLRLPLRQGIGSKHALALDGGSDEMRYGLDFSYNDVEGAMKGSYRKTSSFGSFFSTRIKNVFLNNYLTFNKVNGANSPYGSFQNYAMQNAYWNPYDSITGKMTKLMEDAGGGKVYNPAYNGTLSTKDATDYTRIANTTDWVWHMGRGFKMNGKVGYSRQADQIDFFLPPGHTEYADYSPEQFFSRGEYFQVNNTFINIEAALGLNYQKKFGQHQLYVSTGATGQQTNSESEEIYVRGFTSDKLTDIAFGNSYANARPTSGKINTKLLSGFGNMAYSYDNRYQVEVSGNADASSQFGSDQLIAPHWSAAASWNLHQEHFFRSNKVLDLLKLRASVGTTGTNAFLSYLGQTSYNYYTDRQYIPTNGGFGTRGIGLGAYLTGFANENLKAPQTFKQNIGLDAVLLQKRLSIRFDAYRQKTTDLILPVYSPAYTGFQDFGYYENAGIIENKGFEFQVNYSIIRNAKKSIYWNLIFNGIHNEDLVLETNEYLDRLNAENDLSLDQTRPQQRYVVGKPLSGIWAVRSIGIKQAGQEVFKNLGDTYSTTWNAANKLMEGDRTPHLQGTLGTSLSIKNLSAGIYFTYQLDVEGYNQTLADKVENANLFYNVDKRAAANRWTPAGGEALYKPVMGATPTYATTRFIERNDQINCSTVSLAYTLPQSFSARIKAQNLKVGLMGNNLFGWYAMKAERGIYSPFQRQYTFSINTTF